MSVHIATSPGSWAVGVRKDLGDKLADFVRVISVVDDANYIPNAPAIPKLFQSALYDPGVAQGFRGLFQCRVRAKRSQVVRRGTRDGRHYCNS